jgi:hypothetical protein
VSGTTEVLHLMGIDLPEAEGVALLAAYRDIAAEIAKLRTLDLSDEHPAVVFDPLGDMPR